MAESANTLKDNRYGGSVCLGRTTGTKHHEILVAVIAGGYVLMTVKLQFCFLAYHLQLFILSSF